MVTVVVIIVVDIVFVIYMHIYTLLIYIYICCFCYCLYIHVLLSFFFVGGGHPRRLKGVGWSAASVVYRRQVLARGLALVALAVCLAALAQLLRKWRAEVPRSFRLARPCARVSAF